jgi:hypothetical protein
MWRCFPTLAALTARAVPALRNMPGLARLAVLILCGWLHHTLHAQEKRSETPAQQLLTERFDETHKLIRPQPGESRWMQLDWLTSLWEARVKAAAEGKPIFVWNGSGGAPMCPT